MVKRLRERIEEAFTNDDKEQLVKYMDWVNSSILGYVQAVRRSATIMLLLAAVFELVVDSRKTTISIGSFAISRNSIALTFVPALVSFLFLQMSIDTSKANRLYDAFGAAFKIWSPKAHEQGLYFLLSQPQPAYWAVISPPTRGRIAQFDKAENHSTIVITVLIIFSTVAFEGQAYYVLFPRHPSAIFVWAFSLLITLSCIAINAFTLGSTMAPI